MGRDLLDDHCSTPVTYGLAWPLDNNKHVTDRSEPDNKLGTVDGREIRNKLGNLRCANAGDRH